MGHEEHGAAVDALEDQAVIAEASLEGDVDALAWPHGHGRIGELGDTGHPRTGGVDDDAGVDVAHVAR
jgi:hypothetical protein